MGVLRKVKGERFLGFSYFFFYSPFSPLSVDEGRKAGEEEENEGTTEQDDMLM